MTDLVFVAAVVLVAVLLLVIGQRRGCPDKPAAPVDPPPYHPNCRCHIDPGPASELETLADAGLLLMPTNHLAAGLLPRKLLTMPTRGDDGGPDNAA